MTYYCTMTEAAATILVEPTPSEDKRWAQDADPLLDALLELAHSAELNLSKRQHETGTDDTAAERE